MSKSAHPLLDRVFEAYVLIKQQPRTVPELKRILKHSKNDTIQGWIDAMERNGLVEEAGKQSAEGPGGRARIWKAM